jgi:S-DNA-T family DNA segregation ATPase FtsK/SpoIIIE
MNAYSIPIKEIGLIALAACALYALLAIVSYSPLDPSFSFSGDGTETRNWVGSSGALFADIVLYVFGLVAYLVPLVLAVLGWRLVRASLEELSWPLVAVRLVGWLGLAVCTCLLIQLHVLPERVLPAGAGGVLGQWLTSTGIPVFGLVGLTILGLAGVLVGAQAALGFSWLEVAEATGRGLHLVAARTIALIDRTLDMWRRREAEREAVSGRVQERRESLAEDRKRRANRQPPVIQAPAVVVPPVRQQRLFDLKTTGELPDLELLDEPVATTLGYSSESLEAMSRLLELKLKDFGVVAEVVSVLPGPVITRFEVQPAAGVKVQKISALVKDLARSLAVVSVRIVEVIPGKSVVGIEIPNEHRETVRLKEILATPAFQEAKSALTLALGKDIAGEPVVADVTRMPHLLVAGTTGSGKSVGVNAMLLSILCKATPDEVRLILVDPKMLELSTRARAPSTGGRWPCSSIAIAPALRRSSLLQSKTTIEALS